MSQDNHVTLRGYLTAEPRLYQKTAASTPVTEIRIGSTPRRLNRETGEWQDQPASYYTVKCWRRLAINAASSLHKGDMVLVRGKFYMNSWIDNQQRPRATMEIEADSLGHDLAYGWSHFLRGTRPQPEAQAGINAGEVARQDVGESGEEGGPRPDAGDASDGDGSDDEEYQGGNGWGAPVPEDEPEPAEAGYLGDPVAAVPDPDGHGDGLVPDVVLAAAGLTSDGSLPETEAVPF